jgi:hypothetical protein
MPEASGEQSPPFFQLQKNIQHFLHSLAFGFWANSTSFSSPTPSIGQEYSTKGQNLVFQCIWTVAACVWTAAPTWVSMLLDASVYVAWHSEQRF